MDKRSLKKCVMSVVLLLIIQAVLYFVSKLFQGPPHLIGNDFDAWFPFVKEFIYVYDSWYPFLVFVWILFFFSDREKYKDFFVTSVLTMIVANVIFLVYPTTITRASFAVSGVTSWFLNLTYMLDTPLNCMPSMHCMFCFTTIFGLMFSKVKLKYKIPICGYLVLIILSTMFVKQHVIADVVSAFIIASCCYFISKFHVFDKFKRYFD